MGEAESWYRMAAQASRPHVMAKLLLTERKLAFRLLWVMLVGTLVVLVAAMAWPTP
jgi:hypothetical protein